MVVHLNNHAEPIEKRGEYQYFDWRVFVDEPDATLDQIDSVEYFLHPTFPKPYQVSSERASRFTLTTSGWGEFDIAATINFKDGHKEKVKYHLDLSKRLPQGDGTA